MDGSSKRRIIRTARFLIDVAIVAVSFVVSYAVVQGVGAIPLVPGFLFKGLVFTAICSVFLAIAGVERGSWRHVSIPDLLVMLKACAAGVIAFALAAIMLTPALDVPRSVPILGFLFMVAGMSGIRMAYRIFIEGRWSYAMGAAGPIAGRETVLLYGFTDLAEGYIRLMRRSPASGVRVAGIIDDEPLNRNRSVQGVRVIGTLSDLADIVSQQDGAIREIIYTGYSPSGRSLSRILEVAAANGLRVSRIPDPMQTASISEANIFEPKPIELGDLLNRPEVNASLLSVDQMVKGHVILVTGAGGSIGSELCRQIASVGPEALIVTDSSDYHLYLLDNELRGGFPDLNIVVRLMDVRDAKRIDSLFAGFRPDVVFHAAALKHVPMVEANPIEGVKTNVLGTRNLADAAIRSGVSTFVVISTDKAVNPTNIMGASKRAAEAYCQALDLNSTTTRFKTVRFGNVLGSNGSVVPLFKTQIAKGGPVTVTHPDVVRFFMTIPEAVRLVLRASAKSMLSEGDRGSIMILDMGKPIKVVDLAERIIYLAGLRPHIDIEIVYTGLRPGEKLYEELFDAKEKQGGKTEEGYVIASPRTIDLALIRRTIAGLEQAAASEDAERTVELLSHIVPEYRPQDPKQLPDAKLS